MYKLKGFVNIQALIDNTVGQISPVGELSTHAMTYAKETGSYTNALYPGLTLVKFLSVNDLGAAAVPVEQSDAAIQIINWIYASAIGGTFTNNSVAALSAINIQFNGIISNVAIGEMTLFDTNKYMPAWISYTLEPSLANPNEVRIWLSDAAFRTQYDEYEIVVVPLLDNVDQLIDTFLNVKVLLDAETDSAKINRLQQAIGNYPPSVTKIVEYEWIDQIDNTLRLTVPWGVLIYGAAGNNVDFIKSSIITTILAASIHPQVTWELYIPDVFKATEFIISPLWDNYSVPNETLVAGIYSPTVRCLDLLPKATAVAVGYDSVHVGSVLESSVSNYRSISFLAIGNIDNRDGIMTLSDKFSDYFVVPTTSIDFGRMSLRTQEWVVLLARMLQVAENMTDYSDIPFDMSRLKRGTVMYLVSSYENVQYLVVSRKSYIELFPSV